VGHVGNQLPHSALVAADQKPRLKGAS
jgi:hypothetical protein